MFLQREEEPSGPAVAQREIWICFLQAGGGKTKFSSCGANTIKLLLLIKQPFHKLNSWLGAAQWFCWLPQAKVLCGERLMRQLVTN